MIADYTYNNEEKYVLIPGAIHIWHAYIDQSRKTILKLEAYISEEEQIVAKRYRHEKNRDRYIVQRGILRILLASYLKNIPQEVEVCTNSYGKPFIKNNERKHKIQFSLSHSNDYATFAFGLNNSIGIDIEKFRQIPDMESIVGQHFSPNERSMFLSYPEEKRILLFYRFWTRKEAVLKANGKGLSIAMSSVDVTDKEYGLSEVVIEGASGNDHYCVTDIEGPPGFAGAIALANSSNMFSLQYYKCQF